MGERPSQASAERVEDIIEPRAHDVGGFEVRRALPAARRRSVGPFVFFDHMGPAQLPPGAGMDVRPHPHIGLATVTWLVEGQLMHRDSLGHAQLIRPGELNWMTAGRGIVHSERTPPALREQDSRLCGIQTWVALPAERQEADPGFQHYPAGQLPQLHIADVDVTLIAGAGWGAESPVLTASDTFYADLRMPAGSRICLPTSVAERACYAIAGRYSVSGRRCEPLRLVVLYSGLDAELVALEDTHLLVIGGAPLDGPRFIWWNFVSTERERIERAKSDWQQGRFPRVPGETEFIPLPESRGGR